MKKRIPLLASLLLFLAALLTAGYFNDLGNAEYYMHSLVKDNAKFFLIFQYGEMAFQPDPNNPDIAIDPYKIPQNPKFEKTVSDYFKASLGADKITDSRDKAGGIIFIDVKGKCSYGSDVSNGMSRMRVVENLDTAMTIKVAKNGALAMAELAGNSVTDRKSVV